MNTTNTNKVKRYGVNCVYSLELERLKPKRQADLSNDEIRRDGEKYETRIRSEATIYMGEGYNLGDRFIRHGKGEELWPNGKVKYEGDFMNDTASGKGKMYYEDETLCYEGDVWLNRWHGAGVSYRENGTMQYEGTFHEGLINGRGRFYFENGNLSYEGEAKDGTIHGFGRKYHENGMIYYEGRADMGNPDGFGRVYFGDGSLKYEGELKNLNYSGHGRQYAENGTLEYEGEFSGGKRCGYGRLYDTRTGKLIREGVFPEDDEVSKFREEYAEIISAEDDEADDLPDHLKQVDKVDEEDLFAPPAEAGSKWFETEESNRR